MMKYCRINWLIHTVDISIPVNWLVYLLNDQFFRGAYMQCSAPLSYGDTRRESASFTKLSTAG